MNNKEAIEILKNMTMVFTSRRNGKTMLAIKYAEAVTLAIKALEKEEVNEDEN